MSAVRLRWMFVGVLVVVLMVPALVLTFARLVQPDGGLWVRLVSFTPYALVLYVVAFLLLLAAALRARGAWRSTVAVLGLMALGGVAVHGWWLSPQWVSTSLTTRGPGSTTGNQLTVMTANLMVGQASAARVVELAALNEADVLVLQEVSPAALGRLEIAGADDLYPFSAGEAAPGVLGTVVFAELPLTDVAPLDTRANGYAMTLGRHTTLLAVHPWPPVGDAAQWRADHAAVRRAVAGRGGPALVVGDFNATGDHRVVQELFDLGFRDAATEATSGWQPTWPAGGEAVVSRFPVPPLMAIDHVLVRGPLRALDTETATVAGTDHRAVVATLAR